MKYVLFITSFFSSFLLFSNNLKILKSDDLNIVVFKQLPSEAFLEEFCSLCTRMQEAGLKSDFLGNNCDISSLKTRMQNLFAQATQEVYLVYQEEANRNTPVAALQAQQLSLLGSKYLFSGSFILENRFFDYGNKIYKELFGHINESRKDITEVGLSRDGLILLRQFRLDIFSTPFVVKGIEFRFAQLFDLDLGSPVYLTDSETEEFVKSIAAKKYQYNLLNILEYTTLGLIAALPTAYGLFQFWNKLFRPKKITRGEVAKREIDKKRQTKNPSDILRSPSLQAPSLFYPSVNFGSDSTSQQPVVSLPSTEESRLAEERRQIEASIRQLNQARRAGAPLSDREILATLRYYVRSGNHLDESLPKQAEAAICAYEKKFNREL